MIDTVLFLPLVLITAAGFSAIRHHPMSPKWRPPSSRLTLLGVMATLLLLARRIALGNWWGLIWSFMAVGSMLYAWRTACRAEFRFRDFQARTRDVDE